MTYIIQIETKMQCEASSASEAACVAADALSAISAIHGIDTDAVHIYRTIEIQDAQGK